MNEDKDELQIVEQKGKGVGKRKFEFDQVFEPGTEQADVFRNPRTPSTPYRVPLTALTRSYSI